MLAKVCSVFTGYSKGDFVSEDGEVIDWCNAAFSVPGTADMLLLKVNQKEVEPDELDVNITLAKHMTNMRSSTADVLETLTPPIKMSLEESLDFANEDECVEVTPEAIRVRKIILSREDWYKWRAKQRRQNNNA